MEEDMNKTKASINDVSVQNAKTTITFVDENISNKQYTKSTNVDIKDELTNEFEMIQLNSIREDALRQARMVAELDNSDNILIKSMANNSQHLESVRDEPALPTINIVDKNTLEPSPIIEYADEPLLPLSKACAPLTTILHNLPFYIQMALEETPVQPPDSLTIDESAAIRLYTIEWDKPHQSLYSMLNYTLKDANRENLRPYFKYLKLFLTALVKLPCAPPLTVWRGVTRDLSAEFPPGTPVTWWSFSSTTTELGVLENNMYLGVSGDRTLFSVEVVNGRSIQAHSYFVTENEILLLPGTYMVVQSQFSPAPELHVIHLKQEQPKEVLLEPPFEGILKIVLIIYFKLIIFLHIGARLYPKVQ